MSIAAIVLAAAMPSGSGQPRQLVTIDGEPMVRAIASRVRRSCDAVYVVLGERATAILPALAGSDATVVINLEWREGTASSIRGGVTRAILDRHDAVVICACDEVRADARHIDALIAKHRTTDRVVASRHAGVLGMPVVFGRVWFARLLALAGDRGARDLLKHALAIDWTSGTIDEITSKTATRT